MHQQRKRGCIQNALTVVNSVGTSWHDIVHVLDPGAVGNPAERSGPLRCLDESVTGNDRK